MDELVGYALNYYRDFVAPSQRYRKPNSSERIALKDLAQSIALLPVDADAKVIQTTIYDVGKRNSYSELRGWFQALYEILLGHPQGPRMGSFVALYGIRETMELIHRVLQEEDLGQDQTTSSM